MQSETLEYLISVLGVRQWVRPLRSEPTSTLSVRATQTLVLTPFRMDEAEKAMAHKMISAVQLDEPIFVSEDDQKFLKQTVEDATLKFSAALAFGVNAQSALLVPWLELPSISKFLDHSNESQLTQLKKKSWELLKNFKNTMVKK